MTGFEKGALVLARTAEDNFSLANLMRSNLYSAMATLKVGLDLMLKEEGVKVDEMYGHGGYFKTKGVGTKVAAAAINAPVLFRSFNFYWCICVDLEMVVFRWLPS